MMKVLSNYINDDIKTRNNCGFDDGLGFKSVIYVFL